MFIFFGTRSTELKTVVVAATCPHCHTTGPHRVSIYGTYAHAFWIPMFPMDKSALVQCEHCLVTYDNTTAPPALRTQFLQHPEATSVPTPKWQWIGLGLFGAFILFVVVVALLSPDSKSAKATGGQFSEFERRSTHRSNRTYRPADLEANTSPDDYMLAAPNAARQALAADPAVGDQYSFQPPKANHYLETHYTVESTSDQFVQGRMELTVPGATSRKDSLMAAYQKQFSRAALVEMERVGLVLYIYRR